MTFRSGLLVTSLRRGAGVAEKDDIIETRKRKLKTSQTLPHPLQKPRAKDGHPEMLKAFKSRPERVALDKSEGVVKRHFFAPVLRAPRGCQRRWRTKALEVAR
jgi:hypothetical protein